MPEPGLFREAVLQQQNLDAQNGDPARKKNLSKVTVSLKTMKDNIDGTGRRPAAAACETQEHTGGRCKQRRSFKSERVATKRSTLAIGAVATKMGYDPNKWFNNVEVAVAKVIGRETTQYVVNIYKYYVCYRLAAVTLQRRQEAEKKALKK